MADLNAALESFRSKQESLATERIFAMGAEHHYFHGLPMVFVRCCNVLLKLDDGSELPAHSQYLARFSSVCAGMLDDDGPLSSASPSKKAHLPLTDCSRTTAVKLMSVLYSTEQHAYIKKNRDCCMAVAGLAHKLDMEVFFLLGNWCTQQDHEEYCRSITHIRNPLRKEVNVEVFHCRQL